jgi:MbtH protein
MEEPEETRRYKVVVNDEEQYSIWPADWDNALGWADAGFSGTKAECLQHVETVWQDMRPRSVRERLNALADRTTG